MLDFDKISKITNRLIDKVLNGDRLSSSDLDEEQLSEEDKAYIIDSLQDSQSVNRRNRNIESFSLSKTKGWNKIESSIKQSESKNYNLKRVLKVAAVLLIGVFIGYLTLNRGFIVNNSYVAAVNSDSVLLEFNHGMVKELSTSGITYVSIPGGEKIGTQHGDFLKYKKSSTINKSDIVYHKIK